MNAPQLKTKIPVAYTEEPLVATLYFVKALHTYLSVTTDMYSKGNPEFFTVKVMDKFVYKGHDYDEAFKVFDEHLQLLEPLYFKLFPPPARKFRDVEWNTERGVWRKGYWTLGYRQLDSKGFSTSAVISGHCVASGFAKTEEDAQDWCEKTLTELVKL